MEIVQTTPQAEVQAQGPALQATVNFSGALMEMLATVYSYILLAAIREAIQNGCDAARRKGLSFKEGVLVELPTQDNPVITVIDRGAGMTKDFIESTYMSFGSSTKAGDNGSAGGLGVGRWAAYGYIREAYITTTHEGEMIERTYFQYQGPGGMPQVQLASEVAGTTCGTRVFFPVKENDLQEAYRAVAWLKEVMELTMGDSFTVDKPGLLPAMLPEFSGIKLNLGLVDESLDGVVLYPMKGRELQYRRNGLSRGSLVVLTNQAEGVGGLPFHVSLDNFNSFFCEGIVIEIPMSHRVPFLPSREEVKYTDEFTNLMHRIDKAGMELAAVIVKELYSDNKLSSKIKLSNLLGTPQVNWHNLCMAGRLQGSYSKLMSAALGGFAWTGTVRLQATPTLIANRSTMIVKAVLPEQSRTETYAATRVQRTVHIQEGHLKVPGNVEGNTVHINMSPENPAILVCNDLPSGGPTRYRQWLAQQDRKTLVLYLGAEPAIAIEAAEEISALYGGLTIIKTSTLTAPRRTVVGGRVLRATRGTTLTAYSLGLRKQITVEQDFASVIKDEPIKVWLVKEGSSLKGFKTDISMQQLAGGYNPKLPRLFEPANISRLYLLTEKQAKQLEEARAAAMSSGLWDLDASEVEEDESQENIDAVNALKSWISFEDFLKTQLELKEIQEILEDTRYPQVTESPQLSRLCTVLGSEPRMGLAGTKFDKAISPYLDVMTGKSFVKAKPNMYPRESWYDTWDGLCWFGENLAPSEDDSEERTKLLSDLQMLPNSGILDYTEVWRKLKAEFPLLVVSSELYAHSTPEVAIEHFCIALATVYR